MKSVSAGNVEKIYLFRETVSDTFFSSAVSLKFVSSCSEDEKAEILHRVFSCLDTLSDWQYSLYDFSQIPASVFKNKPEYLVWQKDEKCE